MGGLQNRLNRQYRHLLRQNKQFQQKYVPPPVRMKCQVLTIEPEPVQDSTELFLLLILPNVVNC